MSDYIDLVICKHANSDHPYIFKAPAWSYLKKGDDVIVETKRGEQPAKVERVYTVDTTDSDEFEFILMASGVTTPLRKVLKKIEYKEFEYDDEEDSEEVDE